MFGRRAWYKTHPDIELPWLQTDEAASLRYEGNLNREKQIYWVEERFYQGGLFIFCKFLRQQASNFLANLIK